MQFLSLETLNDYDGGSAGVLFDQALRQAYLDLQDRPELPKKRVVTLVLTLEPEQSEGTLDAIRTMISIKSAIPEKETRVNVLAPLAKGMGFERDTRRAKFAKDQGLLPHSDEDAE